MNVETLHENERYRAVLTRASEPSTLYVIHFPSDKTTMIRDAFGKELFPEPVPNPALHGAPLNLISVQTAQDDWFQSDLLLEVLDSIAALKRPGDVFITFGSSMGGYAAIAYFDALKANVFFASSPQASIAPDYMESIGDHRWAGYARKLRRHGPILDGKSRAARGILTVDPENALDLKHVETIHTLSQCRTVKVPASGHFSFRYLNRQIRLKNIFVEIGRAVAAGQDPLDMAPTLEARYAASLPMTFTHANTEQRFALLAKVGVQKLARSMHPTHVTTLLRHDPSPQDLALAMLLCSNPAAARRELVTTLLDLGFLHPALDMTRADDPFAGFYRAEWQDSLAEVAGRIGAAKLAIEASRLLESGDLPGAAFCADLARSEDPNITLPTDLLARSPG